MNWLPWAIIGLFVVIGGATAATAGLPWQTKREASMQYDRFDERLNSVLDLCDRNAEQIGKLTTSVAVLEATSKHRG